MEIFSFVFVRHLGKLRRPCFRHGELIDNVRELASEFFFSDIELGTAQRRFLRASVVGVASLYFRRNHHPALATTEQPAQGTGFVLRLAMRSPVLFQNVLYPVKQTLGDDWLMLALVYLPGIPKEGVGVFGK